MCETLSMIKQIFLETTFNIENYGIVKKLVTPKSSNPSKKKKSKIKNSEVALKKIDSPIFTIFKG